MGSLKLTQHAVDKLATYAIEGARLALWQEALQVGQSFIDLNSGPMGSVFWWEDRPWVVIFSQNDKKVVTTYPSDDRTVTNRRGAGR